MAKSKKSQGAVSRGEYKKSGGISGSTRVYDYLLTPTGTTAKEVNKNISVVESRATKGQKQGNNALYIPKVDEEAHNLAYKEAKKLNLSDAQKNIQYERAFKKYKSALSNQ
jgi:hypothetical protein